jgi:uncharacterized protein
MTPQAVLSKPSRFNLWAWDVDHTLLVYNSFTGAFIQLRGREADRVADLLVNQGTTTLDESLSTLAAQGILVPETANELGRARALHQSLFEQRHSLRLTLMPTEQCNFRCVYCYEDFVRGRMSPTLIDSIVRFVQREAADLRSLSVSWFGGEPLLALDIIEEISRRLLDICATHNIHYSSGMTTNGFFLTEDRADRCFASRITRFQITLDGPPETHNKLRKLAGGGGTFHTIMAHLRGLRTRSEAFHIRVRVNYTPDVISALPQFIRFLGDEFGGDDRFSIQCHAVGHWGGPNDDLVETCDSKTAELVQIQFMSMSTEAGFSPEASRNTMRPFGSVCYAADPRAFVIGSDGTVYKCTVAFKDPRNHVGKIDSDGFLNIDDHLHRMWTSSGEEVDTGCQQCAFRPACQGNFCPLERLQSGQKYCPPVKQHPERYLPVIAAGARHTGK